MLEQKWIDYLKKQKELKFTFEDVNKLELVHLLMENIGDLDGEIRDGLIYPCLAHLLYDKHMFDTTCLTQTCPIQTTWNLNNNEES